MQILFILLGLLYFVDHFMFYYFLMMLISFALVVGIVNDDMNPTFKIAWIIPMLIFPVFGAPLYLIFGRKSLSNRVQKRFSHFQYSVKGVLPKNREVMAQLNYENPDIARQFRYIENTAIAPVFKGTQTKYLASGEEYYAQLLEELKSAEKFIFIEYFIIARGVMWDSILEILKEKAANGVEVKLFYDDLGTIQRLPATYPYTLKKYGIEVQVFNRFRASLDSFLNYRDHRKIVVIDGKTAFTGGINLADEYINEIERHGHWKDTGVMIKGSAVAKLSSSFLQLWYFTAAKNKKPYTFEYQKYIDSPAYADDGFVQPFYDGPTTGHLSGRNCYMNIINDAKKYVYITTPYLILDNEMITALCVAAESGVDVKIITPHIPDKKTIFMVTRSNYPALIKSGVKIYEYTPGFIHSKTIVADDIIGVVGTTNFDFRSFYLHFENGILMYKSKCCKEIKSDFLNTLSKCQEVSLDVLRQRNAFKRFFYRVIKIFSPLL